MDYPEAPKYVQVTPELLEDYHGRIQYDSDIYTHLKLYEHDKKMWCYLCSIDGETVSGWIGDVELAPELPEVRDHLVRRLSLPLWMRDSAGLVACAAAGTVCVDVLESESFGLERTYRRGSKYVSEVGDIYVSRHNYKRGWRIGIPVHERVMGDRDLASGPETGEAGRTAADAAALAHSCAIVIDSETLILPWPDGRRIWKK